MTNCGSLKVSFTVFSSTATASVRVSGRATSYVKVNTTSSTVTGSPSFHFASSRMSIVSSRPSSLNSYAVPRRGFASSELIRLKWNSGW